MVEAGDGIRLLLRASWQPGPREARPALLTIHGLGGWDEASYGLATGAYAYGLGWHVAAHEHARRRATPRASARASTTRGSTPTSSPPWRR